MSDVPLSLYCPLWGAAFDSAEPGIVGGNVFAAVPHLEEWLAVQQSDVAHARQASVPLCLTVFGRRPPDESIDDGVRRTGDDMLAAARDAVLALRLAKPGWFLHPELAETCFAIAGGGGWHLRRRPAPYRQAFLAGGELPMTPMKLSIADVPLRRDAPGPVTREWDRLEAFRQRSGNASVEVALENFDRSYGFQLTPVDRLAFLFVALDAMLGGMSVFRMGKVRLRRGGFRKRLQAALSLECGSDLDPAAEAAWLDRVPGGRGLRNDIAHGDADATDDAFAGAQERVQHVVRLLLRQYLTFAVRWATGAEAAAARFGLRTQDPLAAAYNKVLEARAAGADEALDLLR